MKNFIDFVADASKDNKLSTEFTKTLESSSYEETSKWFKKHGYTITVDESKKILDSNKSKTYQEANFAY